MGARFGGVQTPSSPPHMGRLLLFDGDIPRDPNGVSKDFAKHDNKKNLKCFAKIQERLPSSPPNKNRNYDTMCTIIAVLLIVFIN